MHIADVNTEDVNAEVGARVEPLATEGAGGLPSVPREVLVAPLAGVEHSATLRHRTQQDV